MSYNKSFDGASLTDKEELHITYMGPSFEEGMQISDLKKELDAIGKLISKIVDNLYENNKITVSSKDIEIYVKIEKGSFWETIYIYLRNPIIQEIISGTIVSIINYLLYKSRRERESNPSTNNIIIENLNIHMNLINSYYVYKNVKDIAWPLKNNKDKVKIKSKDNKKYQTEIVFEDKEVLEDFLKTIEKELTNERIEDNLFGYLLLVDLKKEKYGFFIEKYNKVISAEFETHINLNEIKKILGERIKIKARVTYKNGEIYKVKVISYEIAPEKTLDDFLGE